MWRPFLGNITTHTFDNFIKKNIRIDTAQLIKRKKKFKGRLLSTDLFPYKHTTQQEAQRMKKFEKLQQKVRLQKQLIRDNDIQMKKNEQLVKQSIRLQCLSMREAQLDYRNRIRSLGVASRCRTRNRSEIFNLTIQKFSKKRQSQINTSTPHELVKLRNRKRNKS